MSLSQFRDLGIMERMNEIGVMEALDEALSRLGTDEMVSKALSEHRAFLMISSRIFWPHSCIHPGKANECLNPCEYV